MSKLFAAAILALIYITPGHAEIVCGDGHMGGQVCAHITDPFDGSKIDVGCLPGPCPNWPAGKLDMDWLGLCAVSDYETTLKTDCPTYIDVKVK